MSIAELVLIIDDDPRICFLVKKLLMAEGYRVIVAHSGIDGLTMLMSDPPDLVILDGLLPDIHGRDLCATFREWYSGPCIFLSVVAQPDEKVQAFECGCDDYITKPFHPSEFIARVRAALRRQMVLPVRDAQLECGDLTIDFTAHAAILAGCRLPLTRTEFAVLTHLAREQGRVVSNTHLALRVLGGDSPDELHTIRVHISNLRRKLRPHPDAPQFIHTIPGVGYLFNPPKT
jgi:two-component system KDP operon response regulator KdpE